MPGRRVQWARVDNVVVKRRDRRLLFAAILAIFERRFRASLLTAEHCRVRGDAAAPPRDGTPCETPEAEVDEDVEEHDNDSDGEDDGHDNTDDHARDSVEIEGLGKGNEETRAHYPDDGKVPCKDICASGAVRFEDADHAEQQEFDDENDDRLHHPTTLPKRDDQ